MTTKPTETWRERFYKKIGEVHWDDADATIYVKDFIQLTLDQQLEEVNQVIFWDCGLTTEQGRMIMGKIRSKLNH